MKTLESIEESRAARLVGDHDQYRALSCRTRTIMRKDKERYVRGLTEDVECHCIKGSIRAQSVSGFGEREIKYLAAPSRRATFCIIL